MRNCGKCIHIYIPVNGDLNLNTNSFCQSFLDNLKTPLADLTVPATNQQLHKPTNQPTNQRQTPTFAKTPRRGVPGFRKTRPSNEATWPPIAPRDFHNEKWSVSGWLVGSQPLWKICASPIGSFPEVGMNIKHIKHIWNHHPASFWLSWFGGRLFLTRRWWEIVPLERFFWLVVCWKYL